VTDAFGKRIIIASGEGVKAALAARQYLLSVAERFVRLVEVKRGTPVVEEIKSPQIIAISVG
jgi:hypothetical protein